MQLVLIEIFEFHNACLPLKTLNIFMLKNLIFEFKMAEELQKNSEVHCNTWYFSVIEYQFGRCSWWKCSKYAI